VQLILFVAGALLYYYSARHLIQDYSAVEQTIKSYEAGISSLTWSPVLPNLLSLF
jgi:hypothetical protein